MSVIGKIKEFRVKKRTVEWFMVKWLKQIKGRFNEARNRGKSLISNKGNLFSKKN